MGGRDLALPTGQAYNSLTKPCVPHLAHQPQKTCLNLALPPLTRLSCTATARSTPLSTQNNNGQHSHMLILPISSIACSTNRSHFSALLPSGEDGVVRSGCSTADTYSAPSAPSSSTP
jgi:hypothetical protein